MIDGNISMEEDTELRDLVVQTLENNGVLAKVRAELRASVFLALEEQESVTNSEPLLNKTMEQYLSSSEGKLLFSLVREFLEYFGLDYTISVYDPETYLGKEYNYLGRNKLREKLGINTTTEPLLGELLKNSINVFNNSEKKNLNESRLNKTNETSALNNATFEVSPSKLIHKDSISYSNDNDSSDKYENLSELIHEIPINVTIRGKKITGKTSMNEFNDNESNQIRNDSACELISSDEKKNYDDNIQTTEKNQNNDTCQLNETNIDNTTNLINKSEHLIKFEDTIVDTMTNHNEDITKVLLINNIELQNTQNAQNRRKIDVEHNFGRTVYFDDIIVDGRKEKIGNITTRNSESLLGDLPQITANRASIFSDLPPLNGKKTNLNDLKALMDIGLTGDSVDNYEEDFVSSASGSANEGSPMKDTDKYPDESLPAKLNNKDDEKFTSLRSEGISEEIDDIEEVLSANVSCLEDSSGIKV